MNDLELLRQYSQQGEQSAFTAVVTRHIDLVYSVARRHVASDALAQEITQAVFLDLARQAGKLRPDSHLASWLHVVARRTAVDAVRRERHRQRQEQAAVEASTLVNEPPSDWQRVAPLLDTAIARLKEEERRAVLLRFFEKKSFREIGDQLGASEEAARKRVDRGVERLRGFFAQRGVVAGAALLATEITAHAVQPAPALLSATVSSAVALSQSVLSSATLVKSTHALAMTTLQKTAAAGFVALALAGGWYQRQQIQRQTEEIAALQKDIADSRRELRRAESQARGVAAQLAVLDDENQRLKSGPAPASSPNATSAALQSWLARVEQLRDHLEQLPAQKTPQMRLLTDDDWLAAARRELATDADYRRAMSALRSTVDSKLAQRLQAAWRKYQQANAGQPPAAISELQAFLDAPLDEDILGQFEIVPAKTIPNVKMGGDWIITQKAPVDAAYDNRNVVGPSGSGTTNYPSPETLAIQAVVQAYIAANNGQQPAGPNDLLNYAMTPEQQVAVQKMIAGRAEK